jgi:hypothetical protein
MLLHHATQEDVLAEAGANGGRVLVTREAFPDERANGKGGGREDGAAARQVMDVFEPVEGPEAVQTPKQVGAQLCVHFLTGLHCACTHGAKTRAFSTIWARLSCLHHIPNGAVGGLLMRVCLSSCRCMRACSPRATASHMCAFP